MLYIANTTLSSPIHMVLTSMINENCVVNGDDMFRKYLMADLVFCWKGSL